MENNHSRTWPPTAHTRSQSSSTGPSAMSGNIWWVCVDQHHTRNALSKRSLTASRCLASVQETSMPSSPRPWVKDISRTMRFTVHQSPSIIDNDIGNLHQINHPAIPAGHVLDEPIWSVEQVKESCPNRFLPFPTVVPANKQFCK